MTIHKMFYAAVIGVTRAADSVHWQFVLIPVPDLPGVYASSPAWGDYDNDGRLDFLLSGSFSSSIWRNNGSGFRNVTASVALGLPGVFDGAGDAVIADPADETPDRRFSIHFSKYSRPQFLRSELYEPCRSSRELDESRHRQ